MFTKEEIALAKATVEAIKKITGKVEKITQQEMIRQAQESIAKKEHGRYRLVYKKDRRTIVAEPRGWEWEPKVGDFYYQDSGNRRLLLVSDENEAEDIIQRNLIKRFALIPLLHWERIEEILEEMGYNIVITKLTGYVKCRIFKGEEQLWQVEQRKTRQLAVMQAVIELGKEVDLA